MEKNKDQLIVNKTNSKNLLSMIQLILFNFFSLFFNLVE